jgi:putative transposase
VKLTIPNQGIQFKDGAIFISSLQLTMSFDRECEKINQIEIDDVYAYVSVTVKEEISYSPEVSIGVDLNTTSHCAVVAIKETGKVYKLGKEAYHIHRKYSRTRKFLQKKGLYKVVKKIKHRESNKVRNLNHRISRFIVDLAKKNKGGIHLEKLQGIRKQKCGRFFKYALNSWSFYQLNQFMGYKASLAGVPVFYHESAWTSQVCSQCGLMGERKGKTFKCPIGHVEHADVNAAFNHASPSESIVRLLAERDVNKRNTDIRREATLCV